VQIGRRRGLQLLGAALASPVLPSDSFAETWPSKPIRVIVPLGAGSTIDIVGRIMLDAMAQQLGQTFYVENRGGAGGTIGTAAVARAEPDGYTLLINSSQHTIVPAVYPKLGYDPAQDFAAVALLGSAPNVMVVSPSKGFKTVQDLVAAAKARPGTITYSTTGVGSAVHLSTELFRVSAGFQGIHVPFRGMPEAITEVLTGRVDFCCATAAAALPFIRDGQLMALAVMTPRRSSSLPDVPTSLEAGYPNSSYTFWIGMLAPARTPHDIVDRLQGEAQKALSTTSVIEKLGHAGVDVIAITPAEFDAQIKREIDANVALVRVAGLKFN
jgi:tripartite-type tricarboxylate transporter receptor subunit TctC